jgi:phosphoribosylformimino-5-aminoimidazole carboxamide ribotide isomerase
VEIIPVIDLFNGIVVHGIGGIREHYRPLVSPLTSSTNPIDIASALIEVSSAKSLYIADLDAILGREPHWEIHQKLIQLPVSIWVDAGIRTFRDAQKWFSLNPITLVIGSETLTDFIELKKIVDLWGPESLVFSLDLFEGKPIQSQERKNLTNFSFSAIEMSYYLVELGLQKVIVLDISKVGKNSGTGTDSLCREILSQFPSLSLYVGGGIRNIEEIQHLSGRGIRGVLIASALHDGRISRSILETNR